MESRISNYAGLCLIAFRVRKKAVRYIVNMALNYTILGNYKNVYVTEKSAYFAKKHENCICTNICQRERFLKENYGFVGCTQFSLRVLRAVARNSFRCFARLLKLFQII